MRIAMFFRQAFDFNHMNNVLISRDCRKARLIDIDGNSKGSIQYPSEYIQGSGEEAPRTKGRWHQIHGTTGFRN